MFRAVEVQQAVGAQALKRASVLVARPGASS
jgi:hypothetical protein